MIKKSLKIKYPAVRTTAKRTLSLLNLIQTNPRICHGKPVFKGTRLMVHVVLDLLAAGVPVERILSTDYYPQLTKQHIQAAMQYASVVMNPGDYISFSRT